MITVVIDRDSVAAGDDAVPHGVEVELPDDARIGDAVLWMLDHRYVFMPGVTWIVSLVRDGELHRESYGMFISGGSDQPVVALMSDDGDPPAWTVLPLSSSVHSRTRFSQSPGSGPYLVRARYVSNGRRVDVAGYRTHVSETDEAEVARWAADRHRRWPQYFDEHGNRRS